MKRFLTWWKTAKAEQPDGELELRLLSMLIVVPVCYFGWLIDTLGWWLIRHVLPTVDELERNLMRKLDQSITERMRRVRQKNDR